MNTELTRAREIAGDELEIVPVRDIDEALAVVAPDGLPELTVAADRPFVYLIRHRQSGLVLFAVRERILPETCLADLVYYFKIQRCSGAYDKADRAA